MAVDQYVHNSWSEWWNEFKNWWNEEMWGSKDSWIGIQLKNNGAIMYFWLMARLKYTMFVNEGIWMHYTENLFYLMKLNKHLVN